MTSLPEGKYGVIYADPPWTWQTRSAKGLEGRPQHYARMTLEEIKSLPVADLADKDCWLFLWTTGTHLEQAFQVIRAWGFTYSGMGFVWVKLRASASTLFFSIADIFMGCGYTTRKNAEFCLLARKGSPARLCASVQEVIIEARREHSRKPEEVARRIEAFARGPYVELFARTPRKGWTVWGNETSKFDQSV